MADTDAPTRESRALTDDQITTENKFARRSFLKATGALVTGALAIASGVRATAQQSNTEADKKKQTDSDPADKKKPTDSDDKKKPKPTKTTHPHKKKPVDSDTKKSMEGDWKVGGDPD
jgi:hypothetical protein